MLPGMVENYFSSNNSLIEINIKRLILVGSSTLSNEKRHILMQKISQRLTLRY